MLLLTFKVAVSIAAGRGSGERERRRSAPGALGSTGSYKHAMEQQGKFGALCALLSDGR